MITNDINNDEFSSFPKLAYFIEDSCPHKGAILVYGPPGTGKTRYCKEFVEDGLQRGELCIFVGHGLSKSELQVLFPSADMNFLKLVDLHAMQAANSTAILDELNRIVFEYAKKPVRLAVDSLTHLSMLFEEKELMRLVMSLSFLIKDIEAMAVFTATTSPLDDNLVARLGALVDGAIELKMEENGSGGSIVRRARMPFFKGAHHKRDWINFEITKDGRLVFSESSAGPSTCTLCGKSITGTPLIESNFIFDRQSCLDTYMKLRSAYGSRITDAGLPAEVLDANFFFVDIVGLSDPSLSVKKQVQKINALNALIHSCNSFKKALPEKKIILPTGDGMAIGFLMEPELPLSLSIELHKKMHTFNQDKLPEDRIGIRIGLGSGPIFTVSDINGVQNVWGPGIILARRVMDAGDNYHILLEGNFAEELIALKDEYQAIIKPICNSYEIKHGQKIKLYSAYSHDFGNPAAPARTTETS